MTQVLTPPGTPSPPSLSPNLSPPLPLHFLHAHTPRLPPIPEMSTFNLSLRLTHPDHHTLTQPHHQPHHHHPNPHPNAAYHVQLPPHSAHRPNLNHARSMPTNHPHSPWPACNGTGLGANRGGECCEGGGRAMSRSAAAHRRSVCRDVPPRHGDRMLLLLSLHLASRPKVRREAENE